MFPIKDNVPSRRVPFVTWLIIAANTVIFMFEVSLTPRQLEHLITTLGLTPVDIVQDWMPETVTILTSMFLHSGWFHLISNMWALYIFGDNVEDRMGHIRYPVFYVLCGVAAAGTQVISAVDLLVPFSAPLEKGLVLW